MLLLALTAALIQGAADAAVPLATDTASPSLDWGGCPPGFAEGCKIAVLHGDPSRANADMLLKVPAGYQFPRHRHRSAERMILIGGALRVHYDGSDPVLLKAGHYAYGPAGLAHDARCESKDPCLLFIAFEGPVDATLVDTTSK